MEWGESMTLMRFQTRRWVTVAGCIALLSCSSDETAGGAAPNGTTLTPAGAGPAVNAPVGSGATPQTGIGSAAVANNPAADPGPQATGTAQPPSTGIFQPMPMMPNTGPAATPDDPSAMPDGQEPQSDTDMTAEDGPLNMAPAEFGPNIRVNDDSGRAMQAEVVMASRPDGLVFVGFMDTRDRLQRCGFAVSKDGGETWEKNTFAATQGSGRAFAGDPAVAIDDEGNLFAGCQDYASGGLGTNYILLAHSKDEGASWSDFKRVNQSLDKPWLGALGDGTVLVSWLGRPGGVKRSEDYGETWSEPESLGYINHGTTISIGSTGLVHMGYNTNETTVTYRRSKDYGETWERARDLSPQGRPCRAPCAPRSHPIVGGDADPTGQVVALTWASRQDHPDAENDDDVWVIVSYDEGETFSDPIRVNDNATPSRQFQPWAAVDKYGAVHVVWTDLRDGGQNNTYYARMVDPDVGFEPNVKINDDAGPADGFLGDYKGIDIQGRDVIVTWADTRDDSGDIYFARAREAAAAGGPLTMKD